MAPARELTNFAELAGGRSKKCRVMFIKQLYTGCLSEAAYYIESGGEAAIIDPLRDIDAYLNLSRERKAIVKYIFETHFHADFVSGHLDLAKATGAPIVYGPLTETNFPIHKAVDGEVFHLGNSTIEVLHTPGHTLESLLLSGSDPGCRCASAVHGGYFICGRCRKARSQQREFVAGGVGGNVV